jgi:hypothetical protein
MWYTITLQYSVQSYPYKCTDVASIRVRVREIITDAYRPLVWEVDDEHNFIGFEVWM